MNSSCDFYSWLPDGYPTHLAPTRSSGIDDDDAICKLATMNGGSVDRNRGNGEEAAGDAFDSFAARSILLLNRELFAADRDLPIGKADGGHAVSQGVSRGRNSDERNSRKVESFARLFRRERALAYRGGRLAIKYQRPCLSSYANCVSMRLSRYFQPSVCRFRRGAGIIIARRYELTLFGRPKSLR